MLEEEYAYDEDVNEVNVRTTVSPLKIQTTKRFPFLLIILKKLVLVINLQLKAHLSLLLINLALQLNQHQLILQKLKKVQLSLKKRLFLSQLFQVKQPVK